MTFRARKLPVVINIYDMEGEKPDWIKKAFENGTITDEINEIETWKIKTLEGFHEASQGIDYILQGVDGELYPCKIDIFQRTYEVVTN